MRIAAILAAMLLMFQRPILAEEPTSPPAAKPAHKEIYDKQADGEVQIKEALERARQNNKHVLVNMGANWCPWCHKLHHLFKNNKDIAKTLLYEYELVLIDVDKIDGKQHNADVDSRYGNPIKLGLPVLLVLDQEGKLLVKQETGSLEKGDQHDPAKVLKFLNKWKPKPLVAKEVLVEGLAKAKKESKHLFVYFSAPWCPYCRKLEEYLHREDVAAITNDVYVPVMIDIDRMTGGKELDSELRGDKYDGIPFIAILDAEGKKVADSRGEKGNVGFPVSPEEIDHFMKIVAKTAPKLSNVQITILRNVLEGKQG